MPMTAARVLKAPRLKKIPSWPLPGGFAKAQVRMPTTSCFFCQNLLSDFVEGILPASRHDELKRHLTTCRECGGVHQELVTTMEFLGGLPSHSLSPDMSLRITEASQAGKGLHLNRTSVSRAVLFVMLPLLVVVAVIASFPRLFPWANPFGAVQDESQLARYYPLQKGAAGRSSKSRRVGCTSENPS